MQCNCVGSNTCAPAEASARLRVASSSRCDGHACFAEGTGEQKCLLALLAANLSVVSVRSLHPVRLGHARERYVMKELSRVFYNTECRMQYDSIH